ncbi:MAG: deaD [Cytophagaceae bacterium]|jgi:ATP-dependent RNA helicase DeaD|nr:deaD [Cytophagaceae bacterium]
MEEIISTNGFEGLGLSEITLQAIEKAGYTIPSPIQVQAIPEILNGRDIIGQAQTGTGKTAAFGLPALEKIDVTDRSTQALILCPTRELALQVCNELKKLSHGKRGLSIAAVYGGESIMNQIKDLKRGVHIVVGTPGRVIDHLERKTLQLDGIKMFILDEADEMLNMGFREDIEHVLTQAPKERQTILFSATMSAPILNITKRFLTDPVHVKITKKEVTVDTIEQWYYDISSSNKLEAMTQLYDLNELKLCLVFTNTKKKADEISEELRAYGYKAEALHGDLKQSARNEVMTKFRNGHINMLVATDVAARGIDVNDVDGVFNYDLPQDLENYVHRIGRTGRAGKLGKSFTFFLPGERYRLKELERFTKSPLKRGDAPSKKQLVDFKKTKLVDKINALAATDALKPFEVLLDEYTEKGIDARTLTAGLLQMVLKDISTVEPERKPRKEYADRDSRGSGDRFGDRRSSDRDSRGSGDRFGDRRSSERSSGSRFESRPGSSERRERSSGGYERRERDGGERAERAPRPERSESRQPDANMARVLINLGHRDYVKPRDIVGALAGETGIKGSDIGHIDIFDKHSYVDIPKSDIDRVLDGMRNNTIKGKSVSLEVQQ